MQKDVAALVVHGTNLYRRHLMSRLSYSISVTDSEEERHPWTGGRNGRNQPWGTWGMQIGDMKDFRIVGARRAISVRRESVTDFAGWANLFVTSEEWGGADMASQRGVYGCVGC